MSELKILSGGAAKGLVDALAAPFTAETGCSIGGTFSAVGEMAAQLRSGAPADVIILTASLIADLQREGLVTAGSARDLGIVHTGIALRAADAAVPIHDGAALRAAFLASDAIYAPDLVKSTAGIHVQKMFIGLGIADDVRSRLRVFPNGATAMRELAASGARRPIGCTQVTEILITPGARLLGRLPPEFELATTYTAAVCAGVAHPAEAGQLIALLTSDASSAQRERAGFV